MHMTDFSEHDDQSSAGRELNVRYISERSQTFEERSEIVEMGIEIL
jgi:hypothetical protein